MATRPSIRLDYPLDQILNAGCPFFGFGKSDHGGILLCSDSGSELATGNIVIKGRPGTGKSTLAMQIGMACAESGYLAAYVSMELPVDKVMQKARMFGWHEWLWPVQQLLPLSEPPSSEELGKGLARLLTQPEDCPHCKGLGAKCKHQHGYAPKRRVLLPMLTPRSVSVPDDAEDRLFWDRFRQLENLLRGARWLRKLEHPEITLNTDEFGRWPMEEQKRLAIEAGNLKKQREELKRRAAKPAADSWVSNRAGTLVSREQALTELSKRPSPRLAVVCLDSLNVFGDRPLTREHYFRIFDLFARYGVIGVMVVEENVVGSSDYATMLDDETIDYLSDTVISLTSEEDAGYHMRYLEVTKSRYQPQILGRHPVKTRPRSDKKTVPSPLGRRNGGIQVYPSLHSLMRASEQAGYSGAPALQDWSGLGHMIPANIAKPAVITIAGPLGTFKSTLAENFLVDGLMRKENCLLLRLHDRVADKFPGRLSEDLVLAASGHSWPRVRASDRESETISVPGHDVPGSDKVAERRWNPPGEAKLIELAFRSGNIAAEEFLDEVLTRLVEMKDAGRPIRRVVLDEVSLIGLSYPLLLSSHTGGQLFLPALVHMVRAFGAHMVMTGTRGDLADANACVDRACAISDAVLKSDFCDVFGEKHVTITGAGMTTGVGRVSEDARSSEYVPGVFRVADDSVALRPRPFRIDMEHLRGLVGFETNRIHRPGVSVHLFEQSGHIHRRYTGDLVKMLQFALASPPQKTGGSTAAGGNVVAFNSRTATAMFDSLGVLNDAPIDRTVICTLDEFWQDDTIKHHHALAEFTLNDIRPPKDDIRQGDYVSMTTRTGCSGDDKPRTIAPYYRNVLLLAYRSDVLTEAEQGLLEDEHKSWSDVQWVADQVRRRQPFPHAFEYDLLATETRAAAMMDVILAKSPLARMKKLSLFAADESAERVLLDTDVDLIDNELKALVELLRMAPNRRVDSPAHLEDAEKLYELRRLSEHSAIYLCWYTHLRELVYRHDHLSSRMRFCALPSGGCTGDWFLGIARGSVSIGLGIDVLKILCSDTEEYKRFARGVGLPTVERFKKNGDAFPAWPGSQQMLGEVLGIHDRAWSRSDIANYKLFRRSLYTAFQEFAMSNDDRWQNVAERMFQQIKALQ